VHLLVEIKTTERRIKTFEVALTLLGQTEGHKDGRTWRSKQVLFATMRRCLKLS